MDESSLAIEIERHRAAIIRTDLSVPVRVALAAELFQENTTFFDYGCGYGGDVARMAHKGYISAGWDPYYFPDAPLVPSDIVNLGYVLNVIEDTKERREALLKAWQLTQQVLIVSAQVLIDNRGKDQIVYGDGIVTCRNTFQKYYEQEELKTYIAKVLGVDPVPVALGIYFVFRDEPTKENFRASRWRSRSYIPHIRMPSKRFEDYREQLQPLMEFISDRGRLPVKNELPESEQLLLEFGSFSRAYKVILQATDEAEWDAIAYRRSLDIQVYLALTEFSDRPKLKDLAPEMRQDIKAFFGTYYEACDAAEDMLFSLGKPGVIQNACRQSKIGKHLTTALYVHVSALEALNPLLRLYEGCASRTIGRMEGATLVKFHIDKPQISYLFYPEFDQVAHPALESSMTIKLPDLKVTYGDYSIRKNPPILHRKETFVAPNYPYYEQFAELTRQEEIAGLLDRRHQIGTRQEWENRLAELGIEIREHSLYGDGAIAMNQGS